MPRLPLQCIRLHTLCVHLRKQVQPPPPPTSSPLPPLTPQQVELGEALLGMLEDGMQQRKATCANWMRELRRMSRELSALAAAMKAQAVLLPVASAEETLFDFVNEDEVKVGGGWGWGGSVP